MELFTKLFGSLLVFVYHCFDRIVIHGYLSALSRPEQVVYFFRQIVGVDVVDKEVLSRVLADGTPILEHFNSDNSYAGRDIAAAKYYEFHREQAITGTMGI